MKLFTGISQLVSPAGRGALRGSSHSDLDVTENAAMLVQDGTITWTGPEQGAPAADLAERLDLGDRAVLPGLVDPHTHTVWAGDRLADFDARARGLDYEQILRAGGGIHSTMRATAAASLTELVELALPRLQRLLKSGATTIEIKSGYGFSAGAELRMLEAVQELARLVPARLVPTLLIHVPPVDAAERQAYLEMVSSELIPETASSDLAGAVDVFVERESFSVDETRQLLNAARAHGLAVKVHADQFHAVGGTELATELGALSVDHLEASGPEQIRALADSSTVATILPGVTLHLGLPAAPGRALIDAGAAVAVGTDLNPGSSPLHSAALSQVLAVRLNGLSPAEALVAGTANAAAALGLPDAGRLVAGSPADFIVLNGSDWRELSYDLAGMAVAETWIAGNRRETASTGRLTGHGEHD